MAHSFLDTSTLVKYYHPEDGTQKVTEIIETANSLLFISRLSWVETVSAFAVKFRAGDIDEAGFAALRQRFYYDIGQGLFRIIPMTTARYQEAIALIQYLRRLNGADSMVNPPKFSHFGHHLINKNGIGRFRKQF